MQHQEEAIGFTRLKKTFGLLMEQGTGKTPVEINDAARRWGAGEIDAMIVFAPNGVHANWTLREIPKHMPDWVPTVSAAWTSSPNRAERAALEDLFNPEHTGKLRVLTMNWEALNFADSFKLALKFMRAMGRVKAVADESQRIKNPRAGRTKALMKLKPYTEVRSIDSGTPIIQSPWDAFSQFGWLDYDILGTDSYTTFRAEYAELLPPGHGLLRHIEQRMKAKGGKVFVPQIVAKDAITGRPKWRNLDQLERLITPWTFRRLKSECMDLPEKVYTQRFFRMTARQQKAYDLLRDEFRLQLTSGVITPVQRIAAITKLSQVTSGYFIVPGTDGAVERIMPLDKNPKIAMTIDEAMDSLERGQQVIIWCHFQQEIADLVRVLGEQELERIGINALHGADKRVRVVQLHGNVPKRQRQENINAFEGGSADVMVAQQAAGGTGYTIIGQSSTAAHMSVIYHSNTWSLEDRLQSEDRAHRFGQEKTVTYTDMLAENSVDLTMVDALRNKNDVAKTITGDKRRALELIGYGHG